MPWFVKIIAKIMLSKLPFTTRFWRKLKLFKHGEMHKREYAFQVVLSHYDAAKQYLPKKFSFVVSFSCEKRPKKLYYKHKT